MTLFLCNMQCKEEFVFCIPTYQDEENGFLNSTYKNVSVDWKIIIYFHESKLVHKTDFYLFIYYLYLQ